MFTGLDTTDRTEFKAFWQGVPVASHVNLTDDKPGVMLKHEWNRIVAYHVIIKLRYSFTRRKSK